MLVYGFGRLEFVLQRMYAIDFLTHLSFALTDACEYASVLISSSTSKASKDSSEILGERISAAMGILPAMEKELLLTDESWIVHLHFFPPHPQFGGSIGIANGGKNFNEFPRRKGKGL